MYFQSSELTSRKDLAKKVAVQIKKRVKRGAQEWRMTISRQLFQNGGHFFPPCGLKFVKDWTSNLLSIEPQICKGLNLKFVEY